MEEVCEKESVSVDKRSMEKPLVLNKRQSRESNSILTCFFC